MMRTYLTRKEHEAAGDYSEPVTIRGKRYRVVTPPVFEEMRDTAVVHAVLIDDDGPQQPSSRSLRDA